MSNQSKKVEPNSFELLPNELLYQILEKSDATVCRSFAHVLYNLKHDYLQKKYDDVRNETSAAVANLPNFRHGRGNFRKYLILENELMTKMYTKLHELSYKMTVLSYSTL